MCSDGLEGSGFSPLAGGVPRLSGWGSSQFEDDANETRITGLEERRTCCLPCDSIWSLVSLAQKTGLHDAMHKISPPAYRIQRTRTMGICSVEQSIRKLITSLLPSAMLSILTSSFFSYFVHRLIPQEVTMWAVVYGISLEGC